MPDGIYMRLWLWLAAGALLCTHAALGHSLFLQSESKAAVGVPIWSGGNSAASPPAVIIGPSPAASPAPAPVAAQAPASAWFPGFRPTISSTGEDPLLSTATIGRGIDELAIAQSAATAAKDSTASAKASRQELVAIQVLTDAKKPYDKVRSLVPEAKAGALEVRKFAAAASVHRDHVEKVFLEFDILAKEAADRAQKAVLGWIGADAVKTAEGAEANATTNKTGAADKVERAVAAAAEPYHLALLRNQKFCAETYSKAKSAQSSYQRLVTDAKKMALDAQVLQASGLTFQAAEQMTVAHGMMTQADDLRQWGTKLYNQANTACNGAAHYTMAEQQAAESAAGTTVTNPQMKLPKFL